MNRVYSFTSNLLWSTASWAARHTTPSLRNIMTIHCPSTNHFVQGKTCINLCFQEIKRTPLQDIVFVRFCSRNHPNDVADFHPHKEEPILYSSETHEDQSMEVDDIQRQELGHKFSLEARVYKLRKKNKHVYTALRFKGKDN